jgi:hypothetical protein
MNALNRKDTPPSEYVLPPATIGTKILPNTSAAGERRNLSIVDTWPELYFPLKTIVKIWREWPIS